MERAERAAVRVIPAHTALAAGAVVALTELAVTVVMVSNGILRMALAAAPAAAVLVPATAVQAVYMAGAVVALVFLVELLVMAVRVFSSSLTFRS